MYKKCRTCEEEKLAADFRKDKSQNDGYRTECKVCSRAYHQAAYTIKYGESARTRSRVKHAEKTIRINEYKASCGCAKCDEREPVCLEFHHLDPSEKDFVISTSATRSWEKVEAEMLKCVVLCANCHRKVHAGLIEL